jgi:hypothetical protein
MTHCTDHHCRVIGDGHPPSHLSCTLAFVAGNIVTDNQAENFELPPEGGVVTNDGNTKAPCNGYALTRLGLKNVNGDGASCTSDPRYRTGVTYDADGYVVPGRGSVRVPVVDVVYVEGYGADVVWDASGVGVDGVVGRGFDVYCEGEWVGRTRAAGASVFWHSAFESIGPCAFEAYAVYAIDANVS